MTPLVLSVALLLAGQAAGADLPTLLLPSDENAWVVRIVTTGGFTGRGTGSLTASSAGEMRCLAIAACPERLAEDARRSVSRLVTSIPFTGPAAPAAAPQNSGTCSDCVTTTMTLRRRDRDGERTFSYTWDVSTSSGMPEEALRLHAAIVALATARGQ